MTTGKFALDSAASACYGKGRSAPAAARGACPEVTMKHSEALSDRTVLLGILVKHALVWFGFCFLLGVTIPSFVAAVAHDAAAHPPLDSVLNFCGYGLRYWYLLPLVLSPCALADGALCLVLRRVLGARRAAVWSLALLLIEGLSTVLLVRGLSWPLSLLASSIA
jgi:hypothetical protein